MRSADLAQFVQDMSEESLGVTSSEDQEIIDMAKSRIMGVGDQQYSEGDKQKFELVPIDTLLEWAEEETVDQINYGVMTLVRIREVGPDSTGLDWDCLDLIENGIEQTKVIRGMRKTLAGA